jgi:O-antigen/teichoic acid export membrane protein
MCLSTDTIVLLFGEKWQDASYLLQILTVGEVINLLVCLNSPIFFSLGKPQFNLWALLARALGAVAATIIGMRWGMAGIAKAIVVNSAVNALVSSVLVRKILPVSLLSYMKWSGVPLACSAVMSGAVLLLYWALPPETHHSIRLIACAAVGAVAYVASMRLLSRRLFNEALDYIKIILKIQARKPAGDGTPSAIS